MTIPINQMRSSIFRALQRTTTLALTPHATISRSSTSSFLPSLTINITKIATRSLTTTTPSLLAAKKTKLAHNNEPIPDSPPTTDFSQMDMLGQTPIPSTAVDECFHDGFALNSGVQITGGSGVLLVGGEAFEWRPWVFGPSSSAGSEGGKTKLVNKKGQWDVSSEEQWGFLGRLWPRPDLLIIGVGPSLRPLSPATRSLVNGMGIRVEVLDTRNAASQYNLLATERGTDQVAAALLPLGWSK